MRLALEELRKGLVARSALLFEASPAATSVDERNFSDGDSAVAKLAAFRLVGEQIFSDETSDLYRNHLVP